MEKKITIEQLRHEYEMVKINDLYVVKHSIYKDNCLNYKEEFISESNTNIVASTEYFWLPKILADHSTDYPDLVIKNAIYAKQGEYANPYTYILNHGLNSIEFVKQDEKLIRRLDDTVIPLQLDIKNTFFQSEYLNPLYIETIYHNIIKREDVVGKLEIIVVRNPKLNLTREDNIDKGISPFIWKPTAEQYHIYMNLNSRYDDDTVKDYLHEIFIPKK